MILTPSQLAEANRQLQAARGRAGGSISHPAKAAAVRLNLARARAKLKEQREAKKAEIEAQG